MTRYLIALLCIAGCHAQPSDADDMADMSESVSCVITRNCPAGMLCDSTTGACIKWTGPDYPDLRKPVPDLALGACVFDHDCPGQEHADIRCYKGWCYPWVSQQHCGNGTDGGGADCAGFGDPAVVCCLDPGLEPPKARCTSLKRDVLNCGMCGTKCRECRDGMCIPL